MEKTREDIIKDIADNHDVSVGSVAILLSGLETTGGNQVQFNISELGGMGQWQPGMVMVGDMFNSSLKQKVDRICTELSAWVRTQPKEQPPKEASFLTSDSPATFKGSQNNSHYAYHASDKRLVIENNGKTTLYDTTGYPLTGVQQSQDGSGKHLSFTYPGGTVQLIDLKEITEKKDSGDEKKTESKEK
jgi:hypothetical protein